ncbi:MAG: glycosyltransferase [Muribaculaceae bacterium]|nr:glycosyltransferase [Muribaculaceae bacterium]
MEKNRETTPALIKDLRLEVMICTYGTEGLRRVAAASHPKMEGVQYLVSFQQDANETEGYIPEELKRDDFKIVATATKGLAVNRNIALSWASAPLLLISDDDADYTKEGLQAVIDGFQENPDADIIAFRYVSKHSTKHYPQKSVSLSRPPKGYFISSIEIAIRRESVQGKIWFNENFGVGATFPSGEEDIFIKDCLDKGMKGIYVPKTIVRHDGTTTSGRNLMLPSRPQTKGAIFLRLHPHDWPLRMLAHALREIPLWRKGIVPSPISYCRYWLKGVRMAHKMKVFPTSDQSYHYPCHG